MLDDRDEDEVADEQRERIFGSIDRGERLDPSAIDGDFMNFADEVVGGGDDEDDPDDGGDEDVDTYDGSEIEEHTDDAPVDAEDAEALEHYIPDDIQNNPLPREDRT